MQREILIRENIKYKTKFRSKRNNDNSTNRFESLSKSDETDSSDGFLSKDIKWIDNSKIYKNESNQNNSNYRKDKKKVFKNREKKKSNIPIAISIKSESSSQISKNSNNSRYYESDCYNDLSSGSKISDSSNSNSGHYKESDYYDQNIVNNLWEESRKEIKLFCKEYRVK